MFFQHVKLGLHRFRVVVVLYFFRFDSCFKLRVVVEHAQPFVVERVKEPFFKHAPNISGFRVGVGNHFSSDLFIDRLVSPY